MKASRLICLAALLISCSAYAQTRYYNGLLQQAMLPIVIEVTTTPTDSSVVLYSPLQSSEPIIDGSTFLWKTDTIIFRNKRLGISISMRPDSQGNMQCNFKQGMLKEALVLTPSDTLWRPNRPQTPQEPYSFTEEEVTLTVKDGKHGKITLSGSLTMPKNATGKVPAVVLVSGSGQQNRNSEILAHQPFLVIAEYFARQGIAVLRYDDRGMGNSTGLRKDLTTFDFADDAHAMFNFLRKHKGIDPKRVGIVGHSEGGLIASIEASRNRHVSFIVMMAGPGGSGAEILIDQNARIAELQGVSPQLTNALRSCLDEIYYSAISLPPARYTEAFKSVIDRHAQGLTQEQQDSIGLTKGMPYMLATTLEMPWMNTFIKTDNRPYLMSAKCPILALNGELDCQVVPSNLQIIEQATNGRAETLLIPKANHLFQHCTTGAVAEYPFIEQTIAPEVLEAMACWILKQR